LEKVDSNHQIERKIEGELEREQGGEDGGNKASFQGLNRRH